MLRSTQSRTYLLAALLLVTMFVRADGVDDEEDFINYAFATWIGSGAYRMSARKMFILRAPLSWQFREVEQGKPGYKALLPVTLGIHDSTDFGDKVGSLSFVPGLQADFMLQPRWLVKPYAQAGIGQDFSGGNYAFIYGAGIKTLTWMEVNDYRLSFGLGGLVAGSKVSDGGNEENFSKIDIGIDAGRETRIKLFNQNLVVNAFYAASYFANDAEFPQADEKPGKIHVLHEIGLTFSSNPELEFAGISGLRGGFGYMFGSNNFQGLSLNAGFPF